MIPAKAGCSSISPLANARRCAQGPASPRAGADVEMADFRNCPSARRQPDILAGGDEKGIRQEAQSRSKSACAPAGWRCRRSPRANPSRP